MTQREQEDREYWRVLYAKTSGKPASAKSSKSAAPASQSGSTGQGGTTAQASAGTTPAGTPVGYTSTGKRLKPAKAPKATTAPVNDEKKEAGIVKRGALKLAGTALGGLVAGPIGAAIGNKIADPEWRKNAYRQGRVRPHTAPVPASNQRDIGLFDKADNYDNSFINEAVSKGIAKLRNRANTNR